MTQFSDINAVLDQIMVLQALSSRYEARRWLIEAQDALNRQRITEGLTSRTITEIDHFKSTGRRNTTKVKLSNEQRTLIDHQGNTIPPLFRDSPQITEKSPDLPLGPLFHRMLHERQGLRRTTRKKSLKLGANSGSKRKSTTPKEKTLKLQPNVGTRAYEVYKVLVDNDWDTRKAQVILMKSPSFKDLPPEKRYKNVYAGISNVTKTYKDRVNG